MIQSKITSLSTADQDIPRFPCLVRHNKSRFIVLFKSMTEGTIVYSNDKSEPKIWEVGTSDVDFLPIDSECWEILPKGFTLELTQQ